MGRLDLRDDYLNTDEEKNALAFAKQHYASKVRKDTGRTYLHHCLEVSRLIHKYKYSEKFVIAGLLHDILEHTEVTYEELENEFGSEVAEIVSGVTEDPDPTLSWNARKLTHIQSITNAPEGVLVVSAVDRYHNAVEILQDWLKIGDSIFIRYEVGKEQQKWFYRSLTELYFVKGLFYENKALLSFSEKIAEVLSHMDM